MDSRDFNGSTCFPRPRTGHSPAQAPSLGGKTKTVTVTIVQIELFGLAGLPAGETDTFRARMKRLHSTFVTIVTHAAQMEV